MSWGPRPVLVWTTAAASVATAVAATLLGMDGDRPGALLLGLAAVALTGLTAYGALLNPRLSADASGVAVRTVGGTRRIPWDDLQANVRSTRRLGRDTRTLELEGGEAELIVLGRLELGTDPDDVLAALRNRAR